MDTAAVTKLTGLRGQKLQHACERLGIGQTVQGRKRAFGAAEVMKLLIYLCALMMMGFSYSIMEFRSGVPMPTYGITIILFCTAACFVSVVLVALFITEFYVRIPQALGGAKPQCGHST